MSGLNIFGQSGQGRTYFNPELADRKNKETEDAQRKEELEAKIRGKKGIAPEPTPNPEPPEQPKQIVTGKYILMPQTATYALGAYKLRKACTAENNKVHPKFKLDDGSEIYRPLTFKESLEARLQQQDLFNTWNDTCTSITYEKESTQFKITPISEKLITIDKDFNGQFLPANYNSVQGTELDSTQNKYNEPLLFDEVLEHPGWLTALEGDKKLLKKYAETVWKIKEKNKTEDKAMGFWITQNPTQDQLRALFVSNLDYNSDANGNNYLSSSGSFVRVAQP